MRKLSSCWVCLKTYRHVKGNKLSGWVNLLNSLSRTFATSNKDSSMNKHKPAFKYTGPFRMLTGPSSVPYKDADTGEVLQFACVQDVMEAATLLGFSYWHAGQPKPDNAAYEQLIVLDIS